MHPSSWNLLCSRSLPVVQGVRGWGLRSVHRLLFLMLVYYFSLSLLLLPLLLVMASIYFPESSQFPVMAIGE